MRFTSFKKRQEFIKSKSQLKGNKKYPKIFITEDLTQLRAKLFNYVRETCKDKYVHFHTLNGKIRMKKSAKSCGQPLNEDGKDDGFGKWLYISSTDDLYKHEIDIDF